jgi:hypothetical protein
MKLLSLTNKALKSDLSSCLLQFMQGSSNSDADKACSIDKQVTDVLKQQTMLGDLHEES